MPDLPASLMEDLATGLTNVGGALLGIAARQKKALSEEAKAFYKTQIEQELARAQNIYDTNYETWKNEIIKDPDETHYVDEYQKEVNNWIQKTDLGLTLPESKAAFELYHRKKQSEQIKEVYALARESAARKSEIEINKRIAILVPEGRHEELQEMMNNENVTMVLTPEKQKSILMEDIPTAKKNKGRNDLKGLDINEQIRLSNDPAWQEEHGLDADAAKDLTDSLLYKKQNDMDLKNENIRELQDELITEFLEGITSKTNPLSPGRGDEIYRWLKGNSFQDNVRTWLDKKASEAKALVELEEQYGQQGIYGNMRISIESWNGKGKEPWGLKDLDKAFADKKIDQTQFNLLVTAYTQKLDDIRTGKAAGPNYDDPQKTMELWKIAWNLEGKYKNTDEIHTAMSNTKYLGNGCSGEKWSEIWNKVNQFKGDDKKKSYVTQIGEAYGYILQQMVAQKSDPDEIKRISLEEGMMTQQMISFMEANPGNYTAWDLERDRILSGQSTKEAITNLEQTVGIRWPLFGSYFTGYGRQFTESSKLETLRTWAATTGTQLSQAELGSIAAARPTVINEELAFLKDNKITNIKNYAPAKNGEMNYITTDGKQYKVVQEPVGGVARFVLYQLENGKWIRKNWK